MLMLPATLVVMAALLVLAVSLGNVGRQFQAASEAQAGDLRVIGDAASLSGDIGLIQKRMATALEGAQAGTLDELQLYRMHTAIVNDLDAIRRRVEALATTELVLDANHNSARRLIQEFADYQRFVIMATDVLAVNPAVASEFLDMAQQHYREFSIFVSRVETLLADRSQDRNAAQSSALETVHRQVLWIGIGVLVLLLGLIFAVAQRASRRMLDIADALSSLSQEGSLTIPLPRIETMHRESRGEFGRIAGTLLTFRDAIERQRQAEEEAFQLAFYDPLTRLPNRRLLKERLHHALQVCERQQARAAVLVLDLDDFKRVNDTRGHGIGDRLLNEVVQRLQQVMREGDTLARLGGDEFAVLLEALPGEDHPAATQAEAVAHGLAQALRMPVTLDGQAHHVTASIGIALFDHRFHEGPDTPLRQAEAAMYQAKKDGRNTTRFFDPGIQAQLEARLALESELRLSVERGQLRLFYQLQMDERDRCIGVEGLIRWLHPDRGLVSPAQFIPLAEETGLIVPIGQWVLQTACLQLRTWAEHPAKADLCIAVNVSARQFRDPDFVAVVRGTLMQTGADPRRLKLELTESTVLEDVEATVETMRELRALGVHFSLDDFGTGYSSLQYLKRLPLDQLKIEQSFVRDIITDPDDAVIVQTIIAMSHALGIEVIAEGVETREQQMALHQQGCLAYQGYLFSKPLPIEALEQKLAALTPRETA